jgi:phenylalanyl-tRNA synthetase beta chain
VGPPDPTQPLSSALHPGRQATIRTGERIVGILGEVQPAICIAFKLKRTRPVYLEIDRAALDADPTLAPYAERPPHQPLARNLAFTLPLRVHAQAVADTMTKAAPDWLNAIDMVDLFRHEEEGTPVRTVTFALHFTNDTGTRTADEVNEICEALIAAVESAPDNRGVKLRR